MNMRSLVFGAVYLNHTSAVQAVPGQAAPLAPYEVRIVGK